MGSGPSLNRIDIPSLATVDTLAFNRSYLAWAEWGFAPTHYCCFDMTFVEHHAAELASVIVEHPATGFHINARAFDCGVPSTANVTWVTVASSVTSPGTSTASVLDLGNVGASSLQVLADVGYQRVVLVGVDGAYHAGQTHFRPDYSQGLWVGPLPGADTIRNHWQHAVAACRQRGVAVVNASPGSTLDVVPMVDFSDALDWVRS